MAEFQEISEKAKEIVGEFMSSYSAFQEGTYKILPVSLYALMPDADNAILKPLEKYHVDLNGKLDKKGITVLKEEFPAVVQFCYEHYDTYKSNYIDPLIEICHSSVFTPKQGSKILLPYAGEARFIYDYDGHSFDGYEPDSEAWAYSQILCSAYSVNAEIQLGDSLKNHEDERYDYIFTMPYGRKGVGVIVKELYNMAEERLNEEGCLCCVLPARFCFEAEWQGLRKILIDKKGRYSAAVMCLPELLQKYTKNENVCVFWLHKGGDGKVILMNAKSDLFFGMVSTLEFNPVAHIKTQSIVETFEKGDDRYVWYGSVSDLTDDICLLPTRYLINRQIPDSSEGKMWLRLNDIVELVEGSKTDTNNGDRIQETFSVSFVSLSSDYLDCNVSPQKDSQPLCHPMSLLLHSFSFWERKDVTESCLLAGFYNRRVKVGKFDNSSGSYCLPDLFGHEIIPFRIKSDIVSEDFLLRWLMSEEAEGQIESLPWKLNDSIDSEDFLQIMILVPSKDEQERICKEEAQKRLKETDRELKRAKEKIESDFKEYVEDMHIKKHAIGQTIFDLNNWWAVLQRAREETGGNLTDDTVVGRRVKTKVSEIYDGLHSAISRLQQQISKMDRGNTLSAEVFPLAEFIEDFIRNHTSSLFEFEYNAEKHRSDKDIPAVENIVDEDTGRCMTIKHEREIKKGEPYLEEYVDFPPEALTMVLENIISNACSHGFAGSSGGNKIRIGFGWVGGYIVATVSNNGKPLPEGLLPHDVFTYGETRAEGEHFGIGGYEIKRLMREFGGDVEIESTPSDEFTVSYKLTFPSESEDEYVKKNSTDDIN